MRNACPVSSPSVTFGDPPLAGEDRSLPQAAGGNQAVSISP